MSQHHTGYKPTIDPALKKFEGQFQTAANEALDSLAYDSLFANDPVRQVIAEARRLQATIHNLHPPIQRKVLAHFHSAVMNVARREKVRFGVEVAAIGLVIGAAGGWFAHEWSEHAKAKAAAPTEIVPHAVPEQFPLEAPARPQAQAMRIPEAMPDQGEPRPVTF